MTRASSTLPGALGATRPWQNLARPAFRLLLLAFDGSMLALAFYLAYIARFDLRIALQPEIMPSQGFYLRLVVILIPIWLVLFYLFGLYDFRHLLGGTSEYARVFNGCSAGVLAVIVFSFFEPGFIIARAWLVSAWLFSVILVSLARFSLRRLAYTLRHWGIFVAPAVIVGVNDEALALANTLRHSLSSGLRIIGFVADSDRNDPTARACAHIAPILGPTAELNDIAQRAGIEEVIVAATALPRERLLDLFERLAPLSHIQLRLSSGFFEVLTTGVTVRTWGFVPLISLNRLRLEPFEAFVKTLLDYTLTIALLLLIAPLLLIIGLAVKFDSPGPVFYRRRVLGVHGKPFDAFKFRTMFTDGAALLAQHPDLAAELHTKHKLKDDPRVTPVGRLLRRFSLDELPQLFNVLLGQMSLVGPRMISPAESQEYGRHKVNLLTVKPGITGLWQVSGRSDVSYEERVRLDMHYIRTYSIWRDLQILFIQTPPAVLRGHGAY